MNPSEPLVLNPAGTAIQEEIDRIRSQGPVTEVILPGDVKAWSITNADLLKKALTDPRVSKDPRQHWPAFQNGEVPKDWPLGNWVNTPSMFTAYGADHHRLRKVVAPAFTKNRTTKLQPRISEIVDELLAKLEDVPASRSVDLRSEFAFPLPIQVISELLGVPDDLRQPLHNCVDRVFNTSLSGEEARSTYAEMTTLLLNLVKYRRATPGDDMTSALISAIDNINFTEQELLGTLYLTINAGHETTVSLIDQAIYLLLTHPEHRSAACNGTLGWAQVIEEALRVEAPAAHVPLRYAVEDFELGGVQIAKGDPILACFAGASRDPEVHGETASVFDPKRPTVREHMAFGYGTHHCLGAPLARLEAQVAIPAIFARFPHMALAAGQEIGTTIGFISNGHHQLPVYLRNHSRGV